MEYAIAFEQTPRNFPAYAPDLRRCVAAGATQDKPVREMRTAIAFRILSLQEYSEPCRLHVVPQQRSK